MVIKLVISHYSNKGNFTLMITLTLITNDVGIAN
jgi:hypothetical protein